MRAPAKRVGGALHVREEAFESGAVLGVDLPREVQVEAGVLPALKPLDGFPADLPSAEHEPEEPLAKEFLEAGEVDVLQRSGAGESRSASLRSGRRLREVLLGAETK